MASFRLELVTAIRHMLPSEIDAMQRAFESTNYPHQHNAEIGQLIRKAINTGRIGKTVDKKE